MQRTRKFISVWTLGLSLTAMLWIVSCKSGSKPQATADAGKKTAAANDKQKTHEHKAPHGGTLVELGEEFAHIELVLDKSAGTLTAYALDGEAENSVRVVQPTVEIKIGNVHLRLTAVGNPLTGEKTGDTSQFSVRSETLKGVDKFEGEVVRIAMKGQEFNNVRFRFPLGNESSD